MILIGLGVALYFAFEEYKKQCPEGLMVCLGLEDPETVPAGEEEEEDPAPSSTSNTNPRSALYDTCSAFLVPDETRTCKEGDQAGIMWDWSKSPSAKPCIDATQKWQIKLSSSKDNHKVERTHTINSPRANSFKFKGSKEFVENHNIKFTVIPLDGSGKQITPDVRVGTIDDKNSSESCSIIGGSPVEFSTLAVYYPSTPPVTVAPVDCKGEYIASGTCVSDTGSKICGAWGLRPTVFSAETLQQGAGKACPAIASKMESCRLEPSDGCVPATTPAELETVPDCRLSQNYEVTRNLDTIKAIGKTVADRMRAVGQKVTFDENVYGQLSTNADDGNQQTCTKPDRATESDLPGYYVRTKYLQDLDGIAMGQESSCNHTEDLYELLICNNNVRNIDCVGYWTNTGDNLISGEKCKGSFSPSENQHEIFDLTKHKQIFIEETAAQNLGMTCQQKYGGEKDSVRDGPVLKGTVSYSKCRYDTSCPESCTTKMRKL
jgi:hypothetical protein